MTATEDVMLDVGEEQDKGLWKWDCSPRNSWRRQMKIIVVLLSGTFEVFWQQVKMQLQRIALFHKYLI